MTFARRQYNAIILSNGTVLVTRDSSGADFNNISFKDAARKERWPVLTPELWNPNFITQKWKKMALERFNRCYHSIALLLPTDQILSADGGEWVFNDTKECNK
jgi:galactose oxidase